MRSFKVSRILPCSPKTAWNTITLVDRFEKYPQMSEKLLLMNNGITQYVFICGQLGKLSTFSRKKFHCNVLCNNPCRELSFAEQRDDSALGVLIHFKLRVVDKISTEVVFTFSPGQIPWYSIHKHLANALFVTRHMKKYLADIERRARSAQFIIDHRNRWPML